jgi:hypothetical protein
MRHRTIFILALVILITSCSITKRKYLSGYYISTDVSLKNNALPSKDIPIQKFKTDSRYEEHVSSTPTHFDICTKKTIALSQSITANYFHLNNNVKGINSPQLFYKYKANNILNIGDNDTLKRPDRHLDLGAKRGNEIGILASATPIFALVLESGSPTFGLAYTFLLAGLFLGFIASIVGLIISVISFVRILKKRDELTGLGRAISGIILSTLSLISILVFISGPANMLFIVGIIAAIMGCIFAINSLLKNKTTSEKRNIGVSIAGILISLVLLALSIFEISNFP